MPGESSATARFEDEVRAYYRRNFAAGLVHGIFLQPSTAFVNAYTVLPAFVGMLTSSQIAVGLIAVIAGLGGVLPELFTAYLVEGRPRKKPYLIGVIVIRWISWAVLAVVTYLYARPHPGLVLGVFFGVLLIFSTAGGVGTVVYSDIFARAIPAERRGRFAGARNLGGYTLAIAAGALVKQILQDETGFPFPLNYATLFALSSLTLAVALTGFALIREPVHPVQRKLVSLTDLLHQSGRLVRNNPNFRRLLLTQALLVGGMALAPFYIGYARTQLDMDPSWTGIFLSAQMIGAALSNLLWGWLGDRFGNRLVVLGSAMTGSLAPLCALSVPEWAPFLYTAVFVLLGATLSGTAIGYGNILLEMASVQLRPICVALRDTLLAPVMLFPLAAGALIQHLSYTWAFGAGALLIGMAFFSALRILEPRTDPDGICR